MTAVSLITLRETFEASLIIGIVLAVLQQSEEERYAMFVWLGVIAGIVLSVLLAFLFHRSFGGFQGRAEELYEGIAMLTAAALIIWMVLWMLKQSKSMRKTVEEKVSRHLKNNHPLGIFFLVLVSTAREGVETVIFLQAAALHIDGSRQVLAGLFGIAVAVALSYFIFTGIVRLPLKRFFQVTSVLLILFALDLAVHGVHELQEALL